MEKPICQKNANFPPGSCSARAYAGSGARSSSHWRWRSVRDAADCGAEFHGNIHPGNISRGEGGAALGPRADHEPGDWSTDELEYMAPELFWNGTATAAADVYSIGLLLFAGVTGGTAALLQARTGEHDERDARLGAQAQDERGRDKYTRRGGEKLGPSWRSACGSRRRSAMRTRRSWRRRCAPAWARATRRPWRCSASRSGS